MPPLDLVVAFKVALFGVMGTVVVVAALRASRARARARMALWLVVAREAGLSDRVRMGDGVLTGSSGQLQVRLSYYQEGGSKGTRVEITGPRLARSLTLRPEGVGAFLGFRNRKEVEIGDKDFDRQVSVQGPPALALALLNTEVRRTLRALIRDSICGCGWGYAPLGATGRFEQGVLQVDVPESSSVARESPIRRGGDSEQAGDTQREGEDKLSRVLRTAIDLAARLVTPEDWARRIADNQASEPEPRVRLQALLTLLREFPEHEATREVVRAASEDPDAELRLRAGIALGPEGRNVVLGVARGDGVEDATNARAVDALADSLTLEQASDLLSNSLRTRRIRTARVCLGILARHGTGATLTLAKVLQAESGELGVAAAEALAATGDSSAEPALLRTLAEGMPWLRRAAASALGRVGTRDAVTPLRAAESGDRALRGAARQAIAEIHSRLAGTQGQLSLAGGESGRLSMVEDEAGRLSLSDAQQPAKGSGPKELRQPPQFKT